MIHSNSNLESKLEILTDQVGKLIEGLTDIKALVERQFVIAERQDERVERLAQTAEGQEQSISRLAETAERQARTVELLIQRQQG